MKKKITVHVCDDLVVDVAMFSEVTEKGQTVASIDPPDIIPIHQMIRWLKKKPKPSISRMTPATLGIGLAALCVRWGTWMAFLLDSAKPEAEYSEEPDVSTISRSELDRIYTEASYNLEQLLKLWFQDEPAFWDILTRAYLYLPMPCTLSEIEQAAVSDGVQNARTILFNYVLNQEGAMQYSELVRDVPFRILSNMLINTSVARSGIEEFSTGDMPIYSLHDRRLTPRQELKLFHSITAKMSGIVYHRPVWQTSAWPDSAKAIRTDSTSYPEKWSTSDQSIALKMDEFMEGEL